MTAWGNRGLLSLLWFVAACSGGQTGDPGVRGEFISIDDEPSGNAGPPGSGSSCAFPRAQNLSRPQAALFELDADHVARVDPVRGLGVVERSGDELALVARLRLSGTAVESVLVDDYLLVAVDRDRSGELRDDQAEKLAIAALLLVNVADPRAPRIVDEVMLDGRPLDLHLLSRAGRTLAYLTKDGPTACPSPRNPTALMSFELIGDRLVARDTLGLGEGVLAVAADAERVVVIDGAGQDRARLRLVSLVDPDGAIELGTAEAPVALPPSSEGVRPSFAIDLREDALRLVMSPGQGGASHVLGYDVSDAQALVATSDCSVELESPGAQPLVSFGSGRTFLSSWPAADGNLGPEAPSRNRSMSVGLGADGSCVIEDLPHDEVGMLQAVLDGERVLDVESSADGLQVRLLDGADGAVLGEAQLPMPVEPEGLRYFPWDGGVLRAPSATDDGLLGVYYEHAAELGEPGYGMQLFSFSEETVAARGKLDGSASFDLAGTAIAALSGDLALAGRSLEVLDLRDLDAPGRTATLELAPDFARVWAFGDYLVRMRLPTGIEGSGGVPEDLSDEQLFSPPEAALATLEVIARGGDPELGEVVASLRVNPWAQLVRVGDLLVSVANPARGTPGVTAIEVLDFADPTKPKSRGSLQTTELWLHDYEDTRSGPSIECLDCAVAGQGPRALALPDALVLRAQTGHLSAPEQLDHESFTFHVLDLSDPDEPVLREPVALPDEDHALAAFADGSRVYYAYRLPEDTANGHTRSRFYYRELDFGDPAHAVVSDPINVPGELVAARDGVLYSHELIDGENGAETAVRALQARAGGVEVLATGALGARAAAGFELDDDGHLLVDLRASYTSSSEGLETHWEPTALRILDAASLDPVGAYEVGASAVRLATRGERAYYATPLGVTIIDLHAPAAPGLASYVPLWATPTQLFARDLITGEDPIVHANGSLVLLSP